MTRGPRRGAEWQDRGRPKAIWLPTPDLDRRQWPAWHGQMRAPYRRGPLLWPVPSKNGGQSLTPRSSLRRRTCDHLPALGAWAELPEAPDGADDVALQRAKGLTRCLAFLTSARKVGARLFRVLALSEGDAVENPVELPMTAAVETVADESGGRRLERRGAGVGSELGLALEASAGAEDAGQLASRQQIDTDQLGQWCEPLLGQERESAWPIPRRARRRRELALRVASPRPPAHAAGV